MNLSAHKNLKYTAYKKQKNTNMAHYWATEFDLLLRDVFAVGINIFY